MSRFITSESTIISGTDPASSWNACEETAASGNASNGMRTLFSSPPFCTSTDEHSVVAAMKKPISVSPMYTAAA